jgi:hypothetical protein
LRTLPQTQTKLSRFNSPAFTSELRYVAAWNK